MIRGNEKYSYQEHASYDSSRNARFDRGRREMRRKRRRKRLIKALIAWAVCILLVILIAWATIRVVGYFSSSKQREMRALGIEKMEQGDYTAAIGAFDQALAAMDKDTGDLAVDILRYRAEAEYRMADYEAALYSYDLLMERDSGNLEYWYMASMCAAGLGNTDRALTYYNHAQAAEQEAKASRRTERGGEAANHTAGSREALLAVAAVCVKDENYDQAMSLYENAVRDGIDDGEIYIRMGLCQLAQEKYEDAAATFDQAKAKLQDQTDGAELLKEASYNRAVCSEYLHQYEEALTLFQEYNKTYGPDERAEHEIAFLKSR